MDVKLCCSPEFVKEVASDATLSQFVDYVFDFLTGYYSHKVLGIHCTRDCCPECGTPSGSVMFRVFVVDKYKHHNAIYQIKDFCHEFVWNYVLKRSGTLEEFKAMKKLYQKNIVIFRCEEGMNYWIK